MIYKTHIHCPCGFYKTEPVDYIAYKDQCPECRAFFAFQATIYRARKQLDLSMPKYVKMVHKDLDTFKRIYYTNMEHILPEDVKDMHDALQAICDIINRLSKRESDLQAIEKANE